MPNTQKQYDLFISYTQEDAAWVEGYLLDALKEAGARIYTEEAFALGVPRLVEFERAIRESQHTLLVLSPAYLAQNFAQFTDLLAQSFGLETDTWPVIPLILKDVELPTRLGIGTALDATTPKKQERAIERLCLELRRPVPGPALIPDCPYPGMVPFLEADSPRFFGRVREIQACLEKLRLHPFLTVIGPSGSGKSSLVFAGLIPALKKSRLFGKGDWQVRIMRPGESPHTTLRAALDSFRGDERALLIIDQFEEIFTLTPDEKLAPESTTEVPRFLNALLHLTDKSNIYITLTVRADFYGELMNAAIWKQVQEHRLEIAPLNPENLRQAIIRPAENARVFIEAALVERLLTEATGEPGMLPFVQETLVLLWEHIQRRFLSLHAYEELVAFHSGQIGGQPRTGLQAAMTRRADATLAQLSSQEQSIARRVFLRLVQFGEGRADTRRQQPVAALRTAGDAPELFEQTIQHLTTNRLLTLSGEEGESSHQVDIAHEALIAGWPTLQAWLTERREAEQTRRRLEAKAAEWVRLGRGESGLLDELELMEAKYWFNSPDAFELGYSKSLSTLVKASRAAIRTAEREHEATREHELEQTRKLARTQQQRAAILLIGLVIAIALSLIVFSLNRKANASLTRAEIANTQSAASAGTAQAASTLAVLERNLAETAQANAGQERSKAEAASTLAVAQEATANAASTHAIAERNIAATALAQLDETGALSRIVLSRQLADKALSVLDQQLDLALLLGVEAYKSFDTLDAKLALLTALQRGLNRDIIPFETAIPRQTAPLYSVALSPDGERMAWGDEDGVITVWNYPQGIVERTFRASAGVIIWGLAFSPDGAYLAAGGEDFFVRIWDVSSGERIGAFFNENLVSSLSWNPGGIQLATVAGPRVVVWNVFEGTRAYERNIGFILTAIDWASDGDRLAVGSQNDDIYILDANTGSTLTVLNGHQDAVRSVAWGPDSNMVASTGYDDTVRLWNANAGRELVQLDGHTNDVLSVVFSPDGKTLVSGGRDRQIIVWDVETLEIVNVIQPHQKEIQRIALTPRDGLLLLASVSLDRTVGLFEMRTQQPLNSQFASVPGEAQNLTASSGNSLLVLARRNGFLNFWRVDKETGVVEELIPQKTSEPASLALSPDGTRLALGKTDGTIQIVDIQTNTTILELAQSSPTFGLAFSPDGFTLASSRCTAPDQNSSNPSGCDFGEILLWDLSTGDEPVHIFEGHTNVIRALAFSPNGEILVSGSDDKSIIFWDLVRSAPLEVPLTNHRAGITTLAFSPDGKLVASGSQDNTIILWDVEELAAIHEPLSGFTGSVLSLFFDAGGQTLFSGHRDGAVLQWNVNFDSWLSLACTLAQRNMTPDEWEQFIPDLEYRETCEQALLPTPTPTTTPTPAP